MVLTKLIFAKVLCKNRPMQVTAGGWDTGKKNMKFIENLFLQIWVEQKINGEACLTLIYFL